MKDVRKKSAKTPNSGEKKKTYLRPPDPSNHGHVRGNTALFGLITIYNIGLIST